MAKNKREIYYTRIERIREMMSQKGIDALILFSPIDMFYFSGYSAHKPIYPLDLFRLFPLVITKSGDPFHIVAQNNYRFIKEESCFDKMFVYDEFTQNAEEFIAKTIRDKGLSSAKIGVEEDVLVLSTIEKLKNYLPGVDFSYAADMLLEVRDIKDEYEIELIQQAIDNTIIGFETAFKEIKPGVTEREIASLCECAMIRAGAEGFVEETQVLSGERSKLVRARASNKKIEQGDLILMDMASIFHSYGSDISRPVVVGKANKKQAELAKIIIEVYEKTLNVIKPGVIAGDVDDLVRKEYAKFGFGPEGQAHLAGHGFGLNFHENPIVKPGNKSVFKPGMVFAFEPGIVGQDCGHMRFEDDFVVTETGTKCLSSKLPRKLIEL